MVLRTGFRSRCSVACIGPVENHGPPLLDFGTRFLPGWQPVVASIDGAVQLDGAIHLWADRLANPIRHLGLGERGSGGADCGFLPRRCQLADVAVEELPELGVVRVSSQCGHYGSFDLFPRLAHTQQRQDVIVVNLHPPVA